MKKQYALPAVQVTDEATGEQVTQPKYVDNPGVNGYSSALIPAPDGFPGTTTDGGQIFICTVDAPQSVHDSANAQSDLWTIGTEADDDVTPQQAADYLNQEFRPQNFTELKEALGDEYRDLSAGEWQEQLGI